MHFAQPNYLWLLALLPALAVWIARGRRRRARDWAALAQTGRPPGDGALGWLAAIACLIVALAEPRWGHQGRPPLLPGRDVVLLVDTSRSMGAEDAVPNRLGAAVETAESLVRALGREAGNRVAVVAFAGRGVARAPLTENLGAVADALRALRPGDVRPGGTDLGAALDAALEAFDDQERAEGRTIVIFSDGEDLAGTWQARLDRLRQQGIVVHAVAIGDPERGHPVPSGRDASPLTYHGHPVLSRRSDDALDALARATGGAFVRLGLASADLGNLYLTRIAPVARQRRDQARPPERVERYGVFVLAALVVGLIGSGPRPKRFARGWIAAGAILMLGAGQGGETLVERGRSAYDAGRFDQALAAFEQAIALDPANPIPRYDTAAALFQIGRFTEARAHYLEARLRADAALQAKIDYALGNTALALGEIAEAVRHYDACLASTAPGPDLDAVRRDAAINRRFAEEAEKPPQPQTAQEKEPSRGSPSPKAKKGEEQKNETGSQAPTPAPDGGAGESPSSGRRGPGGAGGSGPAPPGSPEDRLANALEQIRAAKNRRLPDIPPTTGDGDDRMDW